MPDQDDDDQGRRAAAQDWIRRLSGAAVSGEDLEAFFRWRREPRNRSVWDALEAGRHMVDRFVVRPASDRFKVIDIWTGQTAIIAMTAQDEMSEEDAVHTAALLNRRARGGDRSVLQ